MLDPIGLSYDRIKGDKVASELTDAALTTDLINSTLLVGSPVIALTSVFASVVAGVDINKYYKKSDVDACVKDIRGLKGFLFGSTIPLATCKLSPDGNVF